MKQELSLLQIEDNEDDAFLIQRALIKEGYRLVSKRIETKNELSHALDERTWDVVLSDYAMPHFNGLEALKIVLKHASDPPFIIVSGEIGEELAVRLLKTGADDYIRKDNLVRLGQAVKRAIEQREIRLKKIETEKALIESEERFKAIADYTHDWEIWIAPNGSIKWLNSAVERITNYTREEYMSLGKALDQRLKQIIHDEDQAFVIHSLSDGLKNQGSGNDIHFRMITKNGLSKWCSMSYQPIYSAQGEFLGIRNSIRDISERKKAEADLETSEERYRLLFEKSPLGIVQYDKTGVIIDGNENFAAIIDTPKEQFVGLNILQLMPEGEARNAVKDALTTGLGQFEGEFRTINGKNNIYIRAIHGSITDKKGNILGMVGILEDTSKQVKLERRLIQTQKLESIGNLASGIAHDFNNLLFPIIALSDMLLDDLPEGSKAHKKVSDILKAGNRGKELVKQILTFSHKSDSKKITVPFQQIVKEALKLSRSTIPSNIVVSSEINKDCGLVKANPSQLHQIVMNLITNAYHAVENSSGTINIRLHEITVEKDLQNESFKPGTYAKLSVSDTGTGIDPAILGKIFEPYFTTKEKGKGTGLGLSTVYGIIKDHQGNISVNSEPGKGSTFSVYLPLIKRSLKEQPDNKKTKNFLYTGNERILLLDDDDSIVHTLEQMLGRMGYHITAMTNSLEALETFETNPQRFDLVITDITMPKMTGDQFAQALISIRPDIPVILTTGFSDRLNQKEAEQLGIKAFLMKPVEREVLLKTVRNVLDEIKEGNIRH
jgi:PAS domain S-box-containing protein